MGRAGRHHKRKQQAAMLQAKQEQEVKIVGQMDKLIEEGKYAEALEALAESVKKGQIGAEQMYQGAYAYFMLGDYERSISWVNNTLTAEPGHVAARILLGRLCILEDRTDDALAIYDRLLESPQVLDEAEQQEVRDILAYYSRNEADKLKAETPHIAAFMGLIEGAEKPVVHLEPLMTQASAVQAPCSESTSVSQQQITGTESVTIAEVTARIREIKQQRLALSDKLKVLEATAGAYYYAGELSAAAAMLKEALQMDAGSQTALRGLALISQEQGDKEKAVQYASLLKETDFLLLKALRD